uniref:Uncharacterized protein n=1 Tax=Parascaris univalens TaxID=6257 RepID=A0A915ADC8_PARUN
MCFRASFLFVNSTAHREYYYKFVFFTLLSDSGGFPMQFYVQARCFTLSLPKKRERTVVDCQSLLEAVLESLQGYVLHSGQIFLCLKVACPFDELIYSDERLLLTISLSRPYC